MTTINLFKQQLCYMCNTIKNNIDKFYLLNKSTNIKKYLYYYITIIIVSLYHCLVFAVVYPLPEKQNRLIGKNIIITIPKKNIYSLEHFASYFQIGLNNILAVNPKVDVYLPDAESQLIIPHQLILPDTPHTGIIINNAEMRLYYYPKNNNTVIVLPIAIGTIEHATPFFWTTSIKYKKKSNLDPYEKNA